MTAILVLRYNIIWRNIIYKDLINTIISLPHHEVIKMVFNSSKSDLPRIVIKPVLLKKNKAWQSEKIIGNSAFHENIPDSGLKAYLERMFEESQYRQIHIITISHVYSYRMSKKMKLTMSKTSNKTEVKQSLEHDREKKYLLTEGMPVLPLVDLGVFTEDFHIIKSKYYKFRQINNFLKNIVSSLDTDIGDKLDIIEFGCGKSYLTFILYYYFKFIKGINVKIIGYDKDRYVVDHSNSVAKKYNYENLEFIEGDISHVELYKGNVDLMVTLHACDTATDYAINYAIKNRVKYIFCVPCCQKEIDGKINCANEYSLLLRYGLFRERFSALLTDCIRCEILNDRGYYVDAVEFIGEENTPKNAMIRARYTGHKKNHEDAVRKLLSQFGAEHTLLKLIGESDDREKNSGNQ